MDRMKRMRVVLVTSAIVILGAVVMGHVMSAVFAASEEKPDVTAVGAAKPPANSWVAIAIAVSVASGALGAGYAVGKVGSAAIGAASERPELMGRALVFVVIAEGIAVWGLVGAILLIGRL